MNKVLLNVMYYKYRKNYVKSVNKFFNFFRYERLEFENSGLKNPTLYLMRKKIVYIEKNLFKIGNFYVNFGLPRVDLPQGKQFIVKNNRIERLI